MNLYPPPIDRSKPYDLVCFGYNSVDYLCLVEKYPSLGDKVSMIEFSKQGGGQCATASVGAKRLGLEKVLYAGKFGDDEHGDLSLRSIRSEGVEVKATVGKQSRNQVAVIMIDGESGERTITYARHPGIEISPGEFDAEIFRKGKMLLVDGHNINATIEAAFSAKTDGVPVVLDAERVFDGTEKLVDLCWAVLSDERFCHLFTGLSDDEEALIALSDGKRIAGKTLGPDGSLIFDGGKFIRTPALEVDVKDTTGAGDLFHGAFCVGVLNKMPLVETLALANAAAGMKCMGLGGRIPIPDLPAVAPKMNDLQKKTRCFYP